VLPVVWFWYQSFRRTGMLGDLELSLDHLAGRLTEGRGDGSLVRLSTPLAPDEPAARERLRRFAEALAPQIAERWPNEFPTGRP
jgi:hypothetical protein